MRSTILMTTGFAAAVAAQTYTLIRNGGTSITSCVTTVINCHHSVSSIPTSPSIWSEWVDTGGYWDNGSDSHDSSITTVAQGGATITITKTPVRVHSSALQTVAPVAKVTDTGNSLLASASATVSSHSGAASANSGSLAMVGLAVAAAAALVLA